MKFRKLALWMGIGILLVVLYSNFMAAALKAEAGKAPASDVTQSG